MVQRKQVRKKPKDSFGVSKEESLADHVRRGGDSGGRGRGGGGAAMAPAALPGYMRETSSSGARAGRAAVGGEVACAAPPEREPVRAKVVFGRTPYVSRATCSSAMKGNGGAAAAAVRVCPYAYCSLKGHAHASVVPLRSFLASERRLIKTQQSMKQKGVSLFRKTDNGAGCGDGFFVTICPGAGGTATASTVSSDVGCSDLSTEEMEAMVGWMEHVTSDHRSCGDAKDKMKDPDVSVDGSCGSSDVISDGLAEFATNSRGRKEEIDEDEEASVDQEAEDFGACKSDISEELDANDEGNISQGGISVSQIVCFDAVGHPHIEIHKQLLMDDEQCGNYADRGGDASKEPSIDEISTLFGGMIVKDAGSDLADATTCQRNKWITSRRRTPKEGEQIQTFNPRAPNFLPVEPDPDAEKVDLRHQMTDDRKSAEEWMVDYALRRAVNKLARAQKRKVEMLVQAFETVLPPVPSEKKSVQHDEDKKSFAQTRSWQACN